jgi:hypothetical protein
MRARACPSPLWRERPLGRRHVRPDDQRIEIDDSGPIHRYCFYGFVFGRKAA